MMNCYYCGKDVYRKGKKVDVWTVIGKFLLLPIGVSLSVCQPCEKALRSKECEEILEKIRLFSESHQKDKSDA